MFEIPSHLERRHKVHVRGATHTWFAIVAPGLESYALHEFERLGIHGAQIVEGGLSFEGRLEMGWRAHLARIPTRVLLRLWDFRALRFEKLRDVTRKLPWELFLRPDMGLRFSTSSVKSRLYHDGAIEEIVRDAIERRMGEYYPDILPLQDRGFQTIFIRIDNEQVQLSLDATGEPLYKRGYNKFVAEAPIRDTIAAALALAPGDVDWDWLVDPMCGSGTFSLEMAMSRVPRAPSRSFAFEAWPGHRPAAWAHESRKALPAVRPLPKVWLNDKDPASVKLALSNWSKAGLPGTPQKSVGDFFAMKAPKLEEGQRGLLLINPPYGERLGTGRVDFFRELGFCLRTEWRKWAWVVVCPETDAEKAMAVAQVRRVVFRNGGIRVLALVGGALPEC